MASIPFSSTASAAQQQADARESLAPAWDLPGVVQALRVSREDKHKIRHNGTVRDLPSRTVMQQVLDGCVAALFPTHYGRQELDDDSIDFFVGDVLNQTLRLLQEQVRRGLLLVPDPASDSTAANGQRDPREGRALNEMVVEGVSPRARAAHITAVFAQRLPGIRAVLVSDLHAAYQGDPAASSISEILLCYPGVAAIICHRLAHELYRLGVPALARLLAEIAHARTGIDIHPGAQIGPSFFIDHGTGVVIGETAIIGRGVRLYQQVTLGAKRFPTADDGSLVKGLARHPVVEDEVVIYAGATVLGRVTIGRGSVIGGNVWLTHGVPPNSNVSQAQSKSGDCFD